MMNPQNNGRMPSPLQIAQAMNQCYPQAMQNPNMQHHMNLLQNGNAEEGIAYANQLLQTMGMTQEQAMQQIQAFFGNGGFIR